MDLKELLSKETDKFIEEKDGFRKYGKAKFPFTREKAEEFSNLDIETLLDDPYFLDLKYKERNGEMSGLWPANREVFVDFYHKRKERVLNTFLYTGGIGLGKSTLSAISTWIQVYDIITLPDPLSYFGLTKGTTISIISLSKDADKAKKVTFKKKLPFFSKSPFFIDYFPPHIDPEKMNNDSSRLPSELRFPKDIVVFPGTGQAASALGYDIYGADIDEANDMEIIEKSKKKALSKIYDAAEEAYKEIIGRMDSRFPKESLFRSGKKYGWVSVIGQARYPNSFLENKIREAQVLGEQSTIYWVRKSAIEAQPKERFLKTNFFFDVDNAKIIEKINTDKIREERCKNCGRSLYGGAFVGNKGVLVCSIDCYKATYDTEIKVEKEKMSEWEL